MMTMAASTTSAFPVSTPAPASQVLPFRSGRRRHIDPASGRALEILGHAIEYLTDELVHNGGLLPAVHSQIEAIQLLIALNRQIYFECPEVQTLVDRCRAILQRRRPA
ncbi:MAG TPA: hypothetical protein VF730_00510 [Terracidiphilus sp.]